ncbi:MAG: hypothetical protein R3252_10590 [Robiginitalea sp.]|nr:hypothetical protein [Robiginitalea sp.]
MVTKKDSAGALVIVWNADTGWQNALMDSLHKVISPQTYSCKLCQLTHGLAGPRTEWSTFLKTIDRPVAAYHRDEFQGSFIAEQLPGLELPAVLIHASEKWQILLSRDEIAQFEDLEALLGELKHRIP